MLVSISDDLTQIPSQVLAGEGQGTVRQPGGASLTLWRESRGWDVPADADAGSGVCGGGGGHRLWQCG